MATSTWTAGGPLFSRSTSQTYGASRHCTRSTGTVAEGVPASVPRSQAYYWTRRWQEGERESLEAQASGEAVIFDSDDPTDIIRWLLEADD